MNTVFEPSLLFISENDWANPAIRDRFILHLLDNIKNIYEYSICNVYWSQRYEELLWNHPQLPPWRVDRDWKIILIPQIYKYLSQLQLYVNDQDLLIDSCNVTPNMGCRHSRTEALEHFLQLIHLMRIRNEEIFVSLGIENKEDYLFSCKCHPEILKTIFIRNSLDWLKYIDLEEKLWGTLKDSEKFNMAIEITSIKTFEKGKKDFKYQFMCSDKFRESIIEEREHRGKILFSITKRLLLTEAEAVKDAGLQDESIKSQDNTRRFRVTKSVRIHYIYSGEGKIIFTEYLPEGKHDEGLS
ncbi:MAG: hypothetical protein PHD29_09315 [bacterium]|nr:hypothetical protein [bacterium]MDD5354065.1 hypothetical protein [bacterium]